MRVQSLSLENFRNYARLEIDWPAGAIVLYGANAQGKTGLLEAIAYLASGRSPLTHIDRHLINWTAEREGMAYAHLRADVLTRERRTEIAIALAQTQTRSGTRLQKKVRVDRKPRRRSELAGHLNVVLFLPQDMDLIAGSPSGRRRYLDDALSQVDPDYAQALSTYSDTLRKRNALLRHLCENGGDPSQLDPLDERLARSGVIVCQGRRRLIASLSRQAGRIHRELTGAREWLRLDYVPNFDPASPPAIEYQMELALEAAPSGPPVGVSADDLMAAFRTRLQERRRHEIERGMTLTGPHRDEMRFVANEIDLGTFGSRGQQRTAVLTLKLAQLAWTIEQTGESPVLLLDEVLAELDTQRREFLLSQVAGVEQALLTATDLSMFDAPFLEQAHLFQVEGGIVHPLRATDSHDTPQT
jgi:DNA replication and repair protein RecF